MMPTFIIVGAAKAGTTTLFKALDAHPEVFMSPVKEPHYFAFADSPPHYTGPYDVLTNTTEIISSKAEYEALFDGSENAKAVGEASNSYLYFPDAVERIKSAIPDCKIIIMLRNPVERTFSHYRQCYTFGHENLPFAEALQAEQARKNSGWRWHYQYRGQSFYFEAVDRYYKHFGKNNVCIIKFEELRDLSVLMKRVYSFIEVDESFCGFELEAKNVTSLPRSSRLQSAMQKGSVGRRMAHQILPPIVRSLLFGVLARLNKGKRYNPSLDENVKSELISCFSEDIRALSLLTKMNFYDWLS